MTLKGAIQAIPLKKDSLLLSYRQNDSALSDRHEQFPTEAETTTFIISEKSGMRGFLEFPVRFFKTSSLLFQWKIAVPQSVCFPKKKSR